MNAGEFLDRRQAQCELPAGGGVGQAAEVPEACTGNPQPRMLVLKRLGTRSVANHDEMVTALAHEFKGEYEVVEFEAAALPITAQAEALKQAAVFIAPHGSGLANSLFLPDPAVDPAASETGTETHPESSGGRLPVVVELLPWEYPNLTFYVALQWLPLEHLAFLVQGADAYRAMNVDISKLSTALREFLGSAKRYH